MAKEAASAGGTGMSITPKRWQEIKAVLEGALELPVEERSDFLAKSCSHDDSLRRDVESFLAFGDEKARCTFLQSSASHLTLAPGTMLGEYRVQSLLGSGGMGEVYKALDTRLRRDVAIKVLPRFVSSDPDRLRRFEQEAQAAAALSHPNILAVYQMGAHEGTPYIVSELLEGQTLREHLNLGRITIRKTIDCGVQIAHGLAAAHEKGITHRDLKPDNLFITRDGRVKILDFGLAKLVQERGSSQHSMPTLASETEPGVVMGTVGYMAPEQVRGQTVDRRADIFAFGAIVYEALTGQRAFLKPTSVETMNAILNEDPPAVSLLAPAVPLALQRIVRRCLEKNPEQRFQSASDLAFALEALSDSGVQAATASVPEQRWGKKKAVAQQSKEELESGWLASAVSVPRRLRVSAALVIGGTLLLAPGVAWFGIHRAGPPPPQPKSRRLTANPAGNPAIDAHVSSDGKYLAYSDQAGIHLQLIDSGETRIIPPPQAIQYKITGWSPVGWFPDGTKLLAQVTSLGAEHSSMWIISLLGGTAREIHEGGFAWSLSPDGSLIAFTSSLLSSDIWLMGVNGEEPRKIMNTGEGESLFSVMWSPDSQRIAYERFRSGPDGIRCSIESRDLKGGQPTVLLSDPKLAEVESRQSAARAGFRGGAWWLADGRLIYSLGESEPRTGGRDTNLWEMSADAASGRATSKPRRITNWSDFSIAGLNATADGKRLVFCRVSEQPDVYIGDLDASGRRLKTTPRRLTLDERGDNPTAWTPDSKAVLFQSDRSGKWAIYKQALDDDSAEPIVVSAQLEVDENARLSPDGKWIVYLHAAKEDDVGRSAPTQLRRISVSGGPSEVVQTINRVSDLRCTRRGAFCVVGEQTEDQKQLVFTAFDPIKGKDRELMRVPTNPGFPFNATYNWDISPDGSQLAISYPAGENRIRLLSLRGGEPRDVVVNGWFGFDEGPDWSSDGKGFYIGSSSPGGATLLYIDLEGHANALWEQKGSLATWGVPSRDGHHLAMQGWTVDSDVWMLENF